MTSSDPRGIDHDLRSCLAYNDQGEWNEGNIDRVLAVWEGENDGDDWRWVIRLLDGRHLLLRGGCDYTGWDCVSHAETVWAYSAEHAAMLDKSTVVCASLARQVATHKAETAHEAIAADLGHPPDAPRPLPKQVIRALWLEE
jgi:hypothetical protein